MKVARGLNREGIGYEREPQYKATIMNKLGIALTAETEASFGSMLDFAREYLPAAANNETNTEQSSESENEKEAEMAVSVEVVESE